MARRTLPSRDRLAPALLACACLSLLPACKPARPANPAPEPPPYAELAQQYNERQDKLDRFWSRAVVGLKWVDEGGDRHREQGDGHLQFVRYENADTTQRDVLRSPARVALDIDVLGNTAYWLGCDATRFWWVDVYEEDAAYVAHHANFGKPCCYSAGLPLHPIELINLLALDKLNPRVPPLALEPSTQQPVWHLKRWTSFGPERLTIDSKSLEVRQVELLDTLDNVLMTAELTEYEPVEITGLAPPLWPRLPSRARIYNSEGTLEITLTLKGAIDARRDPRKLRDAAFNFDTVSRGIPGVETIVILDADCPPPPEP
jgi:hypothetical protein